MPGLTCLLLAAGFFFSTDDFGFRSSLEAAGFFIGFRASDCGCGGGGAGCNPGMNSSSPAFAMSSADGSALR